MYPQQIAVEDIELRRLALHWLDEGCLLEQLTYLSIEVEKLRSDDVAELIGRRYENRVRKLLEIAAKHEKRLQYYEDKSSLYGTHGQDSKAQAIALVQKYKLAYKLVCKLELSGELSVQFSPFCELTTLEQKITLPYSTASTTVIHQHLLGSIVIV